MPDHTERERDEADAEESVEWVTLRREDVDSLRSAYESLVRERDELAQMAADLASMNEPLRRSRDEWEARWKKDYKALLAADVERDRARAALRRIREAVAVMDGGTIHANGQQFPAPNAIYRAAVLDIIDREATDA